MRPKMRAKIEWPDGKKICATLTVAFEAFTRGGHFKKSKGLEVNLVSLSHANYVGHKGGHHRFLASARPGSRPPRDSGEHDRARQRAGTLEKQRSAEGAQSPWST